jgi:predicted methyltransferase MtxX (methanogen marker protein 4)
MRDALARGKIRGAVRGDLEAADFVRAFSQEASGFQRGVFLEPKADNGVVLGPVGITDGVGTSARVAFATDAAEALERAELVTEDVLVAVLSIGRKRDASRSAAIAASLKESEAIVKALVAQGLDAFHAEVMLEDVIHSADIVVAPDGAAGNLAFRALHLVGGMRSYGALCLGGPPTLVDTSSARRSYEDPLRLAAYLATRRGP